MATSRELLERLELFGVRLGLERTHRLLEAVGRPSAATPVVLIAGTNGKGSTAALLAAIASAAGYRTGLYTSPHLESVHERVRIDGVAISEEALAGALGRVLAATDDDPTYFEALTVAALVHFAERQVDLAVLEVGLGGRLDATNATEPVLSLVTEIGLDHQEHLGSTLEAIAAEKGGILRSGVPAVAHVGEPAARAALARVAGERSAPLRFLDAEAGGGSADAGVVKSAAIRQPLSPLLGDHQGANSALAVAAAETLAELGWRRIDRRAIDDGIAGCRWPGRLEWVDLGSAGRVLLDGAHNPSAARALHAYLERHLREYSLVFGVLGDKRVEEMLPLLAERASRTYLTTAASPRAVPPVELLRHVDGLPAVAVERPSDALAAALAAGVPPVVCGSLYLVGAARTELRRRFGRPRAAASIPTRERRVRPPAP